MVVEWKEDKDRASAEVEKCVSVVARIYKVRGRRHVNSPVRITDSLGLGE
jgi:hypothetical protein